jgi:hypothetical protein
MRYILILAFPLMLLFAFVQYNDPDPWLWIILYGYAAFVAGMTIVGGGRMIYAYIGIAAYFVGIVLLFPSMIEWLTVGKGETLIQKMNPDKMYIEETREFFGLWIALAVMVLNIAALRKKNKNYGN